MRIIILKTIFAAVCFMFLFSCAGETGEQGPAGPAGSDADTMEVMHFEAGVFPSGSYNSTMDTCIINASPDGNQGICGSFTVGSADIYRGLLYFGVYGYIDPSADVEKAYLTLYIIGKSGTPEIECRKISTYQWTEGTMCSLVSADGATWNTYDSVNSWDMDSGGFFSEAISSPTTIDSTGYVTFEIDTQVVQNWIAGVSNYGMLIMSTNEGSSDFIMCETKEGGSPCRKPRLTVYYK